MEPPKYQRKWEEINRAYNRLEKFYAGLIDEDDSFQGPKDFVLNFFRVSYELKEALKKVGKNPNPSEIERFVDNNADVSLSLDITNQEKHLVLNHRRSNRRIGAINTHVHILDPNGRDRTELTIEIDGAKEDCLKVAQNVLFAWKTFLVENDLLVV